MVILTDVNKKIKGKTILKQINYTFENGIYGLLGPNGAGKTTLMRCIAGIYDVSYGNIGYGETSSYIGYLPQKFGLFKELTVNEMMLYFANLKKMDRKKRQEEIERSLSLVNLEKKKDVKVGKLSGGMVRRVGIAQAFLGKPSLILLDEPTVGLDPEERIRFKKGLSQIGKECTVILSTHIVEDVEASCDFIVVMNQGEITWGGSRRDIQEKADGKVYEVEKECLERLKEYYIEKEFEREGKIMYRILSGKPLNDRTEKSTVEDGYLCVLKGI